MPKRPPLSRRRATVVIAVLAVAAGGSATAWAMTNGGGASYRTVSAESAAVQQTIAATGTISPVHSADADFLVAGTVATVKVKVGQHVTVGDLLARLDRSSLNSTLRNARSTLAADRTRLVDDETGQHSSSSSAQSNSPSGIASLLNSSPTVVTPSPSPLPTQTGSGRGGSAPGGSGSGSAGSTKLAKDQQIVIADQQATDAALTVASHALDAVKAACATTASASPSAPSATGRSPDPSPSATPATSDCQAASETLAADQTTVSQAENALAKAEQMLNNDLSAALKSANTGSTSKGSGSQSSGSPLNSGGSTTSVASAAQLASDQADIDQARASVASAKADLDQATLRSTINGRVTAVTIKHGDSVSGSSSSTSPAIEIVGSGQDQVTIDLSASEVRHVKVGMPARVTPDGLDLALTGTVANVVTAGTESSTGSASYPVTITIQASRSLIAGAAANVTVIVATVNGVLTVPTSAVHHAGTSTYVEVLVRGREVRRSVKIGVIGNTRTEITSGLTAGQQVVLANLAAKVPSSSSTLTRSGGFGGSRLGGFGGGNLNFGGAGGGGFVFNGGPGGGSFSAPNLGKVEAPAG